MVGCLSYLEGWLHLPALCKVDDGVPFFGRGELEHSDDTGSGASSQEAASVRTAQHVMTHVVTWPSITQSKNAF